MDHMGRLMKRYPSLSGNQEKIENAYDLLKTSYLQGGKLLACGNGICPTGIRLADFLSIHRAEVFDVILTEYDEQRHIAAEKEVSWEEGYEDGKLVAAVQLIRRKHDKKLSASQAATELELKEEFVANVMAVLKEHKEEDDAGIIKYLKKVE